MERVHVERARERFLSGDSPDASVRTQILASWRRSLTAGVPAERFDIPYEPDLDFDGSLATCAEPVLERLQEQLSGMAVSVVLTDAHGRLLDRRVGESDLRCKLDQIWFAPGFSYAEEHAGTNGVGTTLESRSATLVVGSEHFTDPLRPFACAGAPIHNPLTHRLEGIIDITCRAADANDLMRVLAGQAAQDVERLLLERVGAGPRALMAEFQAACTRTPNPVLAVSGDFVMANSAATRLPAVDREHVEQIAAELARGARGEARLLLSVGETRLRSVRVRTGRRSVGVVLEVSFPRPERMGETTAAASERPFVGLTGADPAWLVVCGAVRRSAARCTPTLLLGEPGVGKYALTRAAHLEQRPLRRFTVLDCAGDAAMSWEALQTALADMTGTVVLRHLERADRATVAAIRAGLTGASPDLWLVGMVTATTVEDSAPVYDVLEWFDTSITLPPLRHRPGDVEALATVLLRRLAPGRRVQCSTETARLLAGGHWPGNVTELQSVLRAALRRRPVGDIEAGDLPMSFVSGTSRRRLSRLEAAERDLIVKTLWETKGNRVRAAAALGMSRATLYRRMSAFGIEFVGQHP
ncbi:sigma-54-dependent Fis family transcriptional regulator [Streptomyces sporangiiformans]|uniref:Fis family transcriptional regulator n=1 Tax=Streptomyces sporangiiformans TaxID=2315329 RepID=A0A505DNT6_9ACTN|nr:helix-turn-helix domain-containing protein [Streptomyces sporangiiformans]TPQ22893.1 Fis family transcriptional regulator [Streptomyces sporangiiformans]